MADSTLMQSLDDASRENAKCNRIWNQGFNAGFERAEDELSYYKESKEEFNQMLEEMKSEHWHIHLAKKESTKELVMEQQVLWKTQKKLVDAKEALKAELEAYEKRRSRIRARMWEDYDTASVERKKWKVAYEIAMEERKKWQADFEMAMEERKKLKDERKKLKEDREYIDNERQRVLIKKAEAEESSELAIEQWNQIRSGEKRAYEMGKEDGELQTLGIFLSAMQNQ